MATLVGGTILIVDDDHGPRRSLAMLVEQAGHRALEASTGVEGIEVATREAPDLVLLDIRLPDRSGTVLLEQLMALDPELPVVIITAYASVETAVDALNLGAASYVVKPLDHVALLTNIERLLERRRLRLENRRLDREMRRELEARRLAETARDMLAQAVEAAGEAIIVTDPMGVILYANPALEGLTGRSPAEVTGTTLDLLDGTSQDVEDQVSGSTSRSGPIVARQLPGNELCRVESTVTPLTDEEGSVFRLVHVWRDVTEKRRLEAIAQSVNVMNNIGYVFAGIRHELGNPVNTLQMTLRMIEAHIERGDMTGAADRVVLARGELEKILFLLRSLRGFSMYERLDLQSLEVDPFIEQFQRLVSADCDLRGVSLDTSVSPRDLRVRADPRALQQVLLNVLTNALDASAKVERPQAALRATGDQGRVTLEVSDNGVGMTEEELANLFRPFVTTKSHGTGLGLVIAKRMMTQMHGTIEVSSRSGEGTRVALHLMGAAGDC